MLHVCVAAEAALADAGVARDDLSAAFYALAGADLPEDFDLLRPAVHALGFGTVMGLDNDTAASLRSGTDNPNAVVVGWGSGVNGMGRNVAGQGYRLPALGDISGDWGGGDDLAREAIWLVARAHDGRGRPTMLTGMVLSTLDVPTVDEMIRKLYLKQADLACFRLLPHVVFRAANAGDAVAQDLVERAATEVVTTAVALLRRLGLLEVPADVVLAGSVFRAEGTLFLESIVRRLQEAAPLARIVVPEIEPVVGAYFCALDLVGTGVDEHARALARATYEALAARAATEVRAW
jgi:N-acetylglucosamine kinase-like BadF-type ATPase